MFNLPEAYVWDFWTVDDGQRYHLFFLYASRALHDPEARHYRASVGHAVSEDLVTWERVTDALVRSDGPAFDDLAIWTGSIVRDPAGTWFMFYTGATLTPAGNVQSIGYATSDDLMEWRKAPGPILRAEPRWYELLSDGQWHDEAFRDPWVFADPTGNGWHMLITARANHGEKLHRGVVGHAWSADLRDWQLRQPLSDPDAAFGQLEVMQVVQIEGQPWLVFNCLASDMAPERVEVSAGGVWIAPAESAVGPFDIAGATLLLDDRWYVGKVVEERGTGRQVVLAFRLTDEAGHFVGGISDPMPLVVLDGVPTVKTTELAASHPA